MKLSLLLASLLLCLSTVFASDDEAKDLFEKARRLEKISDSLMEKAEKACYWGKGGGSHACMEGFVKKFNQEYGAGSFELLPQLNVIRYTGVDYRRLTLKYSGSPYAAEADYTIMSRNLVGSPDEVFPRVKDFLKRRSSGEWHCKGLLLLARLNEDVWWIHQKWSWVLYNWKMSQEDLIVKAEPYRQEGLKLFDQAEKECKGEDRKVASTEAKLLKDYKDDGKFYGIINETLISETRSQP